MGRSDNQARYPIGTRIAPRSPEFVIGLGETQHEVESTTTYVKSLSVATRFSLLRPTKTFRLPQSLP